MRCMRFSGTSVMKPLRAEIVQSVFRQTGTDLLRAADDTDKQRDVLFDAVV